MNQPCAICGAQASLTLPTLCPDCILSNDVEGFQYYSELWLEYAWFQPGSTMREIGPLIGYKGPIRTLSANSSELKNRKLGGFWATFRDGKNVLDGLFIKTDDYISKEFDLNHIYVDIDPIDADTLYDQVPLLDNTDLDIGVLHLKVHPLGKAPKYLYIGLGEIMPSFTFSSEIVIGKLRVKLPFEIFEDVQSVRWLDT